MTESLEMQKGTLVEWLHDFGYKAKIKDKNKNFILTAADGYNINITVYDYSVQYSCSFSINSNEATLKSCNEFNSKWRWVKAYIHTYNDGTNACFVECDNRVNYLAEDGKKEFESDFQTFIEILRKTNSLFSNK
ncbi:YbjN domain-containing protein [Acetobacter sp. AN02]|uniref:YbjN domain-containing protein n=1 Tax=Acetobacter sp. AN02 TaxID=2894186 RepID=UPI0024342956|nr:YbjN domain-containing protein [Acetobacter sp. AN02]MDG6095732.1 YbjN domain-containing protein [Acetobacter sp. AN02]